MPHSKVARMVRNSTGSSAINNVNTSKVRSKNISMRSNVQSTVRSRVNNRKSNNLMTLRCTSQKNNKISPNKNTNSPPKQCCNVDKGYVFSLPSTSTPTYDSNLPSNEDCPPQDAKDECINFSGEAACGKQSNCTTPPSGGGEGTWGCSTKDCPTCHADNGYWCPSNDVQTEPPYYDTSGCYTNSSGCADPDITKFLEFADTEYTLGLPKFQIYNNTDSSCVAWFNGYENLEIGSNGCSTFPIPDDDWNDGLAAASDGGIPNNVEIQEILLEKGESRMNIRFTDLTGTRQPDGWRQVRRPFRILEPGDLWVVTKSVRMGINDDSVHDTPASLLDAGRFWVSKNYTGDKQTIDGRIVPKTDDDTLATAGKAKGQLLFEYNMACDDPNQCTRGDNTWGTAVSDNDLSRVDAYNGPMAVQVRDLSGIYTMMDKAYVRLPTEIGICTQPVSSCQFVYTSRVNGNDISTNLCASAGTACGMCQTLYSSLSQNTEDDNSKIWDTKTNSIITELSCDDYFNFTDFAGTDLSWNKEITYDGMSNITSCDFIGGGGNCLKCTDSGWGPSGNEIDAVAGIGGSCDVKCSDGKCPAADWTIQGQKVYDDVFQKYTKKLGCYPNCGNSGQDDSEPGCVEGSVYTRRRMCNSHTNINTNLLDSSAVSTTSIKCYGETTYTGDVCADGYCYGTFDTGINRHYSSVAQERWCRQSDISCGECPNYDFKCQAYCNPYDDSAGTFALPKQSDYLITICDK
jgi:hypothetical protein